MTIQLVVGLQNPGEKYANTRHNAGAWFVRAISRRLNLTFKQEKKFFGHLATLRLGSEDVRFLLPDTYMNESGKSVGACAGFFKIVPTDILIAHDELDLAPGIARLKVGGGLAGHNGLKDVARALGGSKDFVRMRLGIGHPGEASEVVQYVLKKPSASDAAEIERAIDEGSQVFDAVVEGRFEEAMLRLHTRPDASTTTKQKE